DTGRSHHRFDDQRGLFAWTPQPRRLAGGWQTSGHRRVRGGRLSRNSLLFWSEHLLANDEKWPGDLCRSLNNKPGRRNTSKSRRLRRARSARRVSSKNTITAFLPWNFFLLRCFSMPREWVFTKGF